MNRRFLPALFLAALISSPVCAQDNNFDFGGPVTPAPMPQADDSSVAPTPDEFDILDLPDELFGRRYQSRPRKKLPPLQLDREWDYRFDAQYQSTIKPYMRWYMRQNPATPRQRYLSDAYREGRYGWTRESQGYSAYSLPEDSFGRVMSPEYVGPYGAVRYWDHLNWLHQQYSTTPIDRSYKVSGRPVAEPLPLPIDVGDDEAEDGLDVSLPDLISETKPSDLGELRRQSIWVCRHRETGRLSILFVQPSAQSQASFYEAQAAMTGANSILAIKWKTAPSWADSVRIQAGKLRNVPGEDQVASAG